MKKIKTPVGFKAAMVKADSLLDRDDLSKEEEYELLILLGRITMYSIKNPDHQIYLSIKDEDSYD